MKKFWMYDGFIDNVSFVCIGADSMEERATAHKEFQDLLDENAIPVEYGMQIKTSVEAKVRALLLSEGWKEEVVYIGP
jgi:hypothetical protein